VQELLAREVAMGEYEARSRAQQRELQEREQRLQVALSRAANSEQVTAAFEEKLQQTERDLRKKQGELDVRDRELNSRRREMESWDLLLREKDRKVSVEQKAIDEKELALRLAEDKSKHREIEVERRCSHCRVYLRSLFRFISSSHNLTIFAHSQILRDEKR